MFRTLAFVAVLSVAGFAGHGGVAQETITVTVTNHGGTLEGHTPRGFRGMGTGLFAGDNLNPSFPDGDGVHFFLTFDLAELPAGEIERAELRSDRLQTIGDPFGDLGPLRADRIQYDRFSPDLWDHPVVDHACILAERPAAPVACDVTAAVSAAIAAGQTQAQFRVGHERAGDSDGEPDLALFFISGSNVNEAGIFSLDVTLRPAGQ